MSRAATSTVREVGSSTAVPSWLRGVLLVPALLALLCGVCSGLARLGLPVPAFFAQLVTVHGALMVGGFFGTLIGLERAVALGVRWAWLAPALSGASTLAMLCAAPQAAAWLMTSAALCMTLACTTIWLRQRVVHHAVLTVAAAAWLVGNAVWILRDLVSAVPLWIGFLVLTIAAERLELSRFVPTPVAARNLFTGIVALLFVGAVAVSFSAYASFASAFGLHLFALALLALAVWLLRYDIARRTVHSKGLTRYMAICLLSGYVWLALGALGGLAGALQAGHALRDATLHSLLLGFVFAMVFGHAPVIAPAITRIAFRWHRGYYLPLLCLHLTLAARVFAGLGGWFALRQWAALGNAIVLLLFIVMVAVSLISAQKYKMRKA